MQNVLFWQNMIEKKTAVVVNDDSTQLELLETLLSELELSVQSFVDVASALEYMSGQEPPALVVTDLYMPKVDGWRFCRLLKSPEYQRLNDVPIVVVSATFSGNDSEEMTHALGAAGFMPAPVVPEVFLDQVSSVLNGGRVNIKQRVLIVEDNAATANGLSAAFEEHGYISDWAGTGAAASELLKSRSYNFVVLDHHLPDITGDELLKQVAHANRQRHSHTVALMMTSDSDPSWSLKWLEAGAWGYLRKPLDPVYLIRVCEQAARENALLRVEYHLEQRTLEVQRLLTEKKLLLEELQHRVKNNMHTVATLLQLRSMSASNPQAKNALLEAQGTVRSVLSVYETLHGSEGISTVATAAHIESLLGHVLRAFAASSRVGLEITADAENLSSQTAVTLGIMLNELVTNSIKYAFTGEREGRIKVVIERVGKDRIKVTYSDSGPGVADSTVSPERFGFGLSMVDNLSTEGGGSFTMPADSAADTLDGFSCTVVLQE